MAHMLNLGYNARKVFSKFYNLLYCRVLSLSGNVNTRRMSKPYMGSIFHIKNQRNILVIGNYYVNFQCIYSCLQIPPRENWFQYVCRLYATAINFPCISSLSEIISLHYNLSQSTFGIVLGGTIWNPGKKMFNL